MRFLLYRAIIAVSKGWSEMKRLKKPLRFVLCLLPVALIGGWFTAQYSFSVIDKALLEEAVRQVGSIEILTAMTVAQTVIYAVVCGFFGYLLAEKTGLMKPFCFQKKETVRVMLVSLICGALLSLDAWIFARWIPALGESYQAAGSFELSVWLSSVLYGGVIEEVMMRLFLMSLFALIGWKLFCRQESKPPAGVLVAANVLTAVLFAAGHLPLTAQSFGGLTPLPVVRCFLLNGAGGLVFGRFYRKYGIQYAMLSHILLHVVSRTVWLVFL